MRLIDADALMEYLMTNMGLHDEDGYVIDDSDVKRKIFKDWIDGVPTVDAVPVVRCPDCKHYKSVLCPLSMADGYYWPAHNPDFFCADGERREDDGTR